MPERNLILVEQATEPTEPMIERAVETVIVHRPSVPELVREHRGPSGRVGDALRQAATDGRAG